MLLESILESATLLCMDYTYSAAGFNHFPITDKWIKVLKLFNDLEIPWKLFLLAEFRQVWFQKSVEI